MSSLQLSFWCLFCLILYYLEMEFGLCITKLAYFEMLVTWRFQYFTRESENWLVTLSVRLAALAIPIWIQIWNGPGDSCSLGMEAWKRNASRGSGIKKADVRREGQASKRWVVLYTSHTFLRSRPTAMPHVEWLLRWSPAILCKGHCILRQVDNKTIHAWY